MTGKPRTLFEKIWEAHAILELDDGSWLLQIDRHLINEVTSPQAFEGLRTAGRQLPYPQLTIAVADHNVPTENRDRPISDPDSRLQVETLERNVAEFGVPYVPLRSEAQGIVHVIGPELGLTLPGMTIVCGDSHTSTHGAFGALAFGIGTSEVEHVLATQTLRQKWARTLRVQVEHALPIGTTAKDLVLYIIGKLGTAGGTGHVIEYVGQAITDLDMAGRMTVCNMSIEAGARAGLIAPDSKTFAWLEGRPSVPAGAAFQEATDRWLELRSDPGATFDKELLVDAREVAPMVTWGTSPEAVIRIDEAIPSIESLELGKQDQARTMLDYMGLRPRQAIMGVPIDVVFIGSCTNGRIEDLRSAAAIAAGRHVAKGVRALVVPGSGSVKRQAEEEGLADIFRDAGFEWRDAGCSMCLGMNPDRLSPGQRCASTSNRNFEGRQGPGGRTHLMSPAMAAAAAVAGSITDVRTYF
ncbi:3-isopropylmalate dehydratase large subunit (plasmid) [Sphingobium sp. SJ10-10]|uniref:3-isopropylmalate dehydratase large subunit n=1 Tax=Sphingomonas sp. NS2 TaxID=908605 RepID=A0A0D4ZYM7_9SPHN|nr:MULTISPECIES: 3-isopropylmalate dehydratase large subunit [unclassified Sphingobium]AJW29382.1 3-isopropylmalate dehydratase large subunit [Sphingomonas sp. NS2]AMK26583.1 3-isopropylmalate dehydratase large subunit [Sphingobium sp. TKS]MEC6699603.1 3-isopropylmalate dehydratase large subunit [Sphingobium sp. SJ10-10]NML91707.1 3-isopropylmalate dehydratase large subunit [Sphingobium sp. TB-6]